LRIEFFSLSAAARSEAEETISKRPKNLLKDFNGTDATALGVTAAAVPAIAVRDRGIGRKSSTE
jgi:hypothetical protein